MAAVAVVGTLAILVLPRYRAHVARARMAEAKVNLGTISSHQKAYRFDGMDDADTPYRDKATGYHRGLHYGLDKCGDSLAEAKNELGFRLADCTKSRYRYITNLGNDCGKSDGSILQGQVYPNCVANDEWHITQAGKLTHAINVIESCPGGATGAPSSSCAAVPLPPPPSAPLPLTSTPPSGVPPPSCFHTCTTGCTAWTDGAWGTYAPTLASQCSGTNFMQGRSRTNTRSCANLCTGIACRTSEVEHDNRPAVGTMTCLTSPPGPPAPPGSPPSLPSTPPPCENNCAAACSSWSASGAWSSWQPSDTSNVCSNAQVMQMRSRPRTRSCSNLCSGVSCSVSDSEDESQTVYGTKSCSTDPPQTVSTPGTPAPSNNNGGGQRDCCIFTGTSKELCVKVDALQANACNEIKSNMETLYGVNTDNPPDDLSETLDIANIFTSNVQKRQERLQDIGDQSNTDRQELSEIEQREARAKERAIEILTMRENKKKEEGKEYKKDLDYDDINDIAQKLLDQDPDYQEMVGNNEGDSEWPKCGACTMSQGGGTWEKCTARNGNTWTRACLLPVSERSSCQHAVRGCHRVGNTCKRCDDTEGTVRYLSCTCPTPTEVERVDSLPDPEKQQVQDQKKQDQLTEKYPRCGACTKASNKCWESCEYRNGRVKSRTCACPPDNKCQSYSCFERTPGHCIQCYEHNGQRRYQDCACSSVSKPKTCTPKCGSCAGGKKTCKSKTCNTYTKPCGSSPSPAPKPKTCTPKCGSCAGGKKTCK
ncbi:MAG: hypothetical protein OYH77_02040, partial [Pseudomonadota bacterium]|nr:hypothetical protein [Pseudomonadota bacterium]